jgi:hypothetical protein
VRSKGDWVIMILVADAGKRRHRRFAMEMAGLLRLSGVAGGIYMITVLDVSKAGLRIECPRALDAGTRVEIQCRDFSIIGEIRYSRAVGVDEFHLGIEATALRTAAGAQTNELDLLPLFPVT